MFFLSKNASFQQMNTLFHLLPLANGYLSTNSRGSVITFSRSYHTRDEPAKCFCV